MDPAARPEEPPRGVDLYRPEGPGPFPVLVFVPGGAWRHDGRRAFPGVPANVGEAVARRGWIVAVPGHRLAPAATYADEAADVARAVAWVGEQATALRADPRRLVLGGHSSGAHLAALVALERAWLEAAGVPEEHRPRGVIALSGAFDLPELARTDPRLVEVFRPAFGVDRSRWVAASPLQHVRPGAPPFLVVVGDGEAEPARVDSARMVEALRLHGDEARLFVAPGRDHEEVVVEFGSPGDPIEGEVLRFLEGVR